ncbi:MAG: aminotransferase class I/II-fold pyridoxal phosphate-dependent enzyme [Longimicrobiales bacterium]|nr:aminotransferase class I/II-fold pyridoxal phosphate-dependent enzyme [Longimicrobiales bacterium]
MVERFRPIRFSRAGVRGLQVSATLSINDRVKELWAAGQNVYHLAFGESRFPVHPKIADALCRNVQKRCYLPAAGIPELRKAIAEHYGRVFDLDVAPDQVVAGPGSKSLIFATLQCLGEEIIIPQPSWVTYAPQVHLLGKPITWVPTYPESHYLVETDALQVALQESHHDMGNPEVLILNNPGNPTGTMRSPEQNQPLADFCREQELMVISDEIYARTAFTDIPFVSFGKYYPEGTVVMGGLSKDLSLGGWRFGVAVVPSTKGGRALATALTNIASNVWSCVAAPVQYAALVAYSGDPEVEEYVKLCARMHSIRTRYLYDLMVELGVQCVEPSGAFYIFPCFDQWRDALHARGIHNDKELALHLLEKYEIAALPGSAFHAVRNFCLRISSSFIDLATDDQADALVAAFRDDPDPKRFIRNHHPRLQKVAERFGEFIEELKR